MSDIIYLNFDVQIQRAAEGGGYRVLVDSPSGESVRVPFDLPVSELELENFLLKAGPARRGVRRVESQEMDAARRFGEKLYSALFTADVRSALQSSLDQARWQAESSRMRVGVRIRLRLTDVPEIANVPWEYTFNPSLNRFLSLSIETPLVRYLDLPERTRVLKVTPPLRILVVVPGPTDYAALDVQQEWSSLNTALQDLQHDGLVELELLETPTLSGLQRHLRRGEYHIFHFIGHGVFDSRAEDGMLVFEDEEKRGRLVSGQDLAMLLHDHPSLRLAVLNACEGARTASTDPYAGVAQSLVQGGLPAVIAMQFEITDRAAIAFAHEFYRAIADGYPVDAAVTEARKVIFTESRGNGLEWGTPVLYMRSPDGQIFDVQGRRAANQERLDKISPPMVEPELAVTSTASSPPEIAVVAASIKREAAPVPPPEPASKPSLAAETAPSTPRTATRQAVPRQGRGRLLLAGAALLILLLAGSAWLLLGGGPAAVSPVERDAQAKAHYDSALSALNNGDTVKAINELSQAIQLKPDDAQAYFYRGSAYHSKAMDDEAIADFNEAIRLKPSYSQAYLQRGNVYLDRGDANSAVEDFTKAISYMPTMMEAYYGRAEAYASLGDYDKALDDASKVIDLAPGFDDGYHQLGLAYAHKTDYQTAIQNYNKAIALKPDHAEVYLHRAEAYEALGDKERATADYQAVLDKSEDDSDRAEAEQRLRLLDVK
jgi:tetratricopeptide (TPR) repeat protein